LPKDIGIALACVIYEIDGRIAGGSKRTPDLEFSSPSVLSVTVPVNCAEESKQ
jgi:hypothetical protein